jgi:enoyl-CoA hydratase
MDDPLLVDVSDRVGVVTLARPEVRNALSPGLSAAIRDTVDALQGDDRVDVVILTGADPAFCAGVDLKALSAGDVAADVGVGRGPFLNRTKLLIGAVNGPAVAGGLELALNCDFLVASERARFADTHARVGVMPGWGLTVLLPQRVGVARAREISVTGNFIDAETALTWGLVNHVVAHEELLPFCRDLAAACAAIDQRAVRRILGTYADVARTTVAEGWKIEADVNHRWMREAFDASKLDADRGAIIGRGREQAGTVRP